MSVKISIIKKNQVIAWMLTLILSVAGILNYANDPKRNYAVEVSGKMEDSLGDAVLVDSSNLVSNVDDYMNELKESEKVSTANEYFAKSRMERSNQYAEQMEIYEKMIENSSISEEQKATAQEEVRKIQQQKNAISIAENLIKLKGIGEVFIMQNGNSVNVVVAEEELSDAKVAQIQNIIHNELNSEIKDIHINNL